MNKDVSGSLKSLGNISLSFNYIKNLRLCRHDSKQSKTTKSERVPEKALKDEALSHRTVYDIPNLHNI